MLTNFGKYINLHLPSSCNISPASYSRGPNTNPSLGIYFVPLSVKDYYLDLENHIIDDSFLYKKV